MMYDIATPCDAVISYCGIVFMRLQLGTIFRETFAR